MSAPIPTPARRRRFTFGIRGLMLLVLVVAICCGMLVSAVDLKRREAKMWTEIIAQQVVTFETLHIPDPVISQFSSTQPLQFGGSNRRDGRRWQDSDSSWVDEKEQRRYRTRIAVAGGAPDGSTALDPIVIEDRGGELNAHFIAKLVAAYQAKGWAYRVVTKSSVQAP